MTRKQAFWLGLILLILGLGGNIAETSYFGWHMFPASTTETYADIVTGIPAFFGLMLLSRSVLEVKIYR